MATRRSARSSIAARLALAAPLAVLPWLAGCGTDALLAQTEALGRAQQAYAGCPATVQGIGDVGAGWVGLRTDGSIWRGSPAMKDPTLSGVVSLGDVDGEAMTFCAVRGDHTLWCWGRNHHGQVGDGTMTDQPVPIEVTPLGSEVHQASTSNDFSCAALDDGTAWCWGGNEYGQLGNGTTDLSLVPVRLVGLGEDVAAISAGYVHACALKNDDSLWCWGDNTYGEIGNGSFASPQLEPVQVMTDVLRFSAGGFFTCAIDSSHRLWCWGANADGHLGIGTYQAQNTPQQVATLGTTAAQVDASVRSGCAIDTFGGLWCWGYQGNGRLGDGVDADTNRNLPARVSGPLGTSGAATLYLTEGAGCAITLGSELWCWGGGGFLDGTGASTVPLAIDFCSLPELNDVQPRQGSTLGGTVVTLTGANFDPDATVSFDDEPAAAVEVLDATSIEATTPEYWQAVVDVVVTNPGDRQAMLPQVFSFVAPPRLYTVDPAWGPEAGGTICTLNGGYFQDGAVVSFGGAEAVDVVVVDDETIELLTPAHATGAVDVEVTNPDAQSASLPAGFTYGGTGGTGTGTATGTATGTDGPGAEATGELHANPCICRAAGRGSQGELALLLGAGLWGLMRWRRRAT